MGEKLSQKVRVIDLKRLILKADDCHRLKLYLAFTP